MFILQNEVDNEGNFPDNSYPIPFYMTYRKFWHFQGQGDDWLGVEEKAVDSSFPFVLIIVGCWI